MNTALPLSLFPSTGWWMTALSGSGTVRLSTSVRKTTRHLFNRYQIITANGAQLLSVPIMRSQEHTTLAQLMIAYTHSWERQHWGALYSAYGRAPYFEHYAPSLNQLIHSTHESLEALSLAALNWLVKEMRVNLAFESAENETVGLPVLTAEPQHYHQIFEERWGFVPNLSAIDLLMNEGPHAADFLTSKS